MGAERASRAGAAALVLGGLVAGLLLAEGLMAGAGKLYALYRGSASGGGDGKEHLLCVGDSFTFGLGAPRGKGYPDQLRALLSQQYPGRFRVSARAVPGSNSSQLLKSLPRILDKESPDILLVLTGWNDYKLTESNYWKVADLSRVPLGERLRLRWLDLSGRWRTLRLLRRLWERRAVRKTSRYERWLALDRVEGQALSERLAALDAASAGEGFKDWLTLGILRHRARRFDAAAAAFGKAASLEPSNAEAHFRLGWMLHLQRDFQGSKRALRAALAADPGHDRAKDMLRYHDDRIPSPSEWLGALLSYDLRRICREARRRGAMVVLQTYPSPRHEINDGLRGVYPELSKEGGVTLVDHGAAVRARPDKKELFSGDEPELFISHPNERGYRLMSENLLRAMRENGMLDQRP